MIHRTTKMSFKKLIINYPMLFGAFLGVLIILAIVISETWFPWISEGLGQHRRVSEAVLYTAFAFAVCAYTFRRWRHRSARVFWTSISIFFLLHVLGIFLYSTRVGPILGWQWIVLLYLEGYLAAFFVGWSTQRFGHSHQHRHPDEDNAI